MGRAAVQRGLCRLEQWAGRNLTKSSKGKGGKGPAPGAEQARTSLWAGAGELGSSCAEKALWRGGKSFFSPKKSRMGCQGSSCCLSYLVGGRKGEPRAFVLCAGTRSCSKGNSDSILSKNKKHYEVTQTLGPVAQRDCRIFPSLDSKPLQTDWLRWPCFELGEAGVAQSSHTTQIIRWLKDPEWF